MNLMFHDDDCGALLDSSGECHVCRFHPDMQSTSFREVAPEHVEWGLAHGYTFLGEGRDRVTPKFWIGMKEPEKESASG